MAVKAYEVLIQTPAGPRPYSVWATSDSDARNIASRQYQSERSGFKGLGKVGELMEKHLGTETAQSRAEIGGRNEAEINARRHMEWAQQLAFRHDPKVVDAILAGNEVKGGLGWLLKKMLGREAPSASDQLTDTLVDIRNNMIGKSVALNTNDVPGFEDLPIAEKERIREGLLFGKSTGTDPDLRRVLQSDERGNEPMPVAEIVDPISGMYKRKNYLKL